MIRARHVLTVAVAVLALNVAGLLAGIWQIGAVKHDQIKSDCWTAVLDQVVKVHTPAQLHALEPAARVCAQLQ